MDQVQVQNVNALYVRQLLSIGFLDSLFQATLRHPLLLFLQQHSQVCLRELYVDSGQLGLLLVKNQQRVYVRVFARRA